MSRDETHGGLGWGFLQCVWAPVEKGRGTGSWPFWSKISDIVVGDVILHLRGVKQEASFVGYSTAATDGYRTMERPPEPGAWASAKSFFRADLKNFVAFRTPLKLAGIFSSRREALEEYFDNNKQRGEVKKRLFFVRQNGRLQCLNGAYLSEVDSKLFDAMFALEMLEQEAHRPEKTVVHTGEQLSEVRSRIGQDEFSDEIKKLYGHRCCFPSCPIVEESFLVGSHIARWSDNDSLRGHLSNGLCLCLMHDKAFEIGLFTLDNEYQVIVSSRVADQYSPFVASLKFSQGQRMRLATILPSAEALAEHRLRVKFVQLASNP